MRALLVIALLLVGGTALAQSPPPSAAASASIRAYLEPDKDVFVGQLTRLWLEIKSPGRFLQAPRYPDVDVDGAIAVMPEQLGVNFSEGSGDATLIGQRQRYVVIPQRAGELRIPAITVNVTIAGADQQPRKLSLKTDPLTMTVTFPPGSDASQAIVTVPKITVDEKYDRDFEGLAVGDAVTRSITMRADGTLALALPKITFAELPGTEVYPTRPVFEDKVNRGVYRARRTDAATYVFSRAGDVTLPEITVSWFDPEAKAMQSETLPAVRLSVVAGPAVKQDGIAEAIEETTSAQAARLLAMALEWLQRNIVSLTLLAILAYVAVLAWRRYAARVIAACRTLIARLRNSEPAYFFAFRRACWSGHDDRIAQAFWQWLDRLTPPDQTATLARFADALPQADDLAAARGLSVSRYGGGSNKSSPTPDKRGLFAAIARFRQGIMRRRDMPTEPGKVQLNPRGSNAAQR